MLYLLSTGKCANIPHCGIIKQLKHLTQNKATGPDEFPAKVLKETAEK